MEDMSRYVVYEHYSGCFEFEEALLQCGDVFTAKRVCEALRLYRDAQGLKEVFEYSYKQTK